MTGTRSWKVWMVALPLLAATAIIQPVDRVTAMVCVEPPAALESLARATLTVMLHVFKILTSV